MPIKGTLIEEVKKDNWFIDTYNCIERRCSFYNFVMEIYDLEFIPDAFRCKRYIERTNDNIKEKNEDDFCKENCKTDLTQLFNDYLEEYKPIVWLHSVLSARELGLKVEINAGGYTNEWYAINDFHYLSSDFKYRINYKGREPIKLVPDEVWDILDDDIIAIAKNDNSDIVCFDEIPKPYRYDWVVDDGHYVKTGFKKCGYELKLKILNDAKIHDEWWKDSLCIRP